ncbi:ankyrin repeat domain-containing protein [Comamonas denitrificans]
MRHARGRRMMGRRPLVLGCALGLALSALSAHGGALEDFQTAIVRDNDRAIVNLLLRGMDPNTVDAQGQPALVKALRLESWRVADALLLGPKLDVNKANPQGETPLMLACIKGRLDFVERLLQKGAQANRPGWTPLHYAASADHPDSVAIARLLIQEHYAYIDAQSPNGSTPLMLAAQYGSQAMVELLLEEGADSHVRNQLGLAAQDFAQRSQRDYLVELLQAQRRSSRRAPASW